MKKGGGKQYQCQVIHHVTTNVYCTDTDATSLARVLEATHLQTRKVIDDFLRINYGSLEACERIADLVKDCHEQVWVIFRVTEVLTGAFFFNSEFK